MNYYILNCEYCQKSTEHTYHEYMEVEHDENGTPFYYLESELICLECDHLHRDQQTKPKP